MRHSTAMAGVNSCVGSSPNVIAGMLNLSVGMFVCVVVSIFSGLSFVDVLVSLSSVSFIVSVLIGVPMLLGVLLEEKEVEAEGLDGVEAADDDDEDDDDVRTGVFLFFFFFSFTLFGDFDIDGSSS